MFLKTKKKLPQMERLLEKQSTDSQTAKDTKDKPFELTLHFNDKDKVFTEADKRGDVGLALVGRINTSLAENTLQGNKELQHIASYRGFEIYHNPSVLANANQGATEEHLFIKGQAQYSTLVSLDGLTFLVQLLGCSTLLAKYGFIF